MNLALKDVSYNKVKFLSSMFGVSLLIMVAMALGGIIRGVILDSATIIEATGADLWVVQAYGSHPAEGTLGHSWRAHAFPNPSTMPSRPCPVSTRRAPSRRAGSMLA